MKLIRVDLNVLSLKGLKGYLQLLSEGAEEVEPEGGVALPLAFPDEDIEIEPPSEELQDAMDEGIEIPDDMPDEEDEFQV